MSVECRSKNGFNSKIRINFRYSPIKVGLFHSDTPTSALTLIDIRNRPSGVSEELFRTLVACSKPSWAYNLQQTADSISLMDKNYNFERKKLMLPEYGRHIHQMVDYLCTIEDRALRNEQAQVVVEVMGNINPVLRDATDFKHKLWDHLLIMSDFKLDVDSPYPMPDRHAVQPKPDKLEYPSKKITYRHYGKNIEHMLAGLKDIPDEQARRTIAINIAKYMRAKAYEYNQEYLPNDIILNDIHKMSHGVITLTEEEINSARNDYKQAQINNRTRKNYLAANRTGNKNNGKLNKQGNKRWQNRTQYK